jgi:hypothetical protein
MKQIDFSKDKHVVLYIGKPKRGKTTALSYDLMYGLINGHFNIVLIMSKTLFNNRNFSYMPKYMKMEYNLDKLKQFVEKLKKLVQKNKIFHAVLVFDDLCGVLNGEVGFIENLLTTHRHYNLSILISTQKFKARNSVMRVCCSYMIAFKSLRGDTMKNLFDEFGQEFENFKQFKNHFLKITKNPPYNAMFFDSDADGLTNNYFKIKYPDVSKTKLKFSFD